MVWKLPKLFCEVKIKKGKTAGVWALAIKKKKGSLEILLLMEWSL